MRYWCAQLLAVALLAQLVLTIPSGKHQLLDKTRDGSSSMKNSQSNRKQIMTMGKRQNNMVENNEFKFASGSLNKGEHMKQMASKQKVDSTHDHPMMQQTSNQLHLQSDQSTDDKLMKMLNSGKDPKLEFPKSSNTRMLSDDHKDKWAPKRSRKGRHSKAASMHQERMDHDEHEQTKPAKRHFNVFKVKERRNDHPYRDVHRNDFDKVHRPRYVRPEMKEDIAHEESMRMRRLQKHHQPEHRYSHNRNDKHRSRNNRKVDNEGTVNPKNDYQETEDREYLAGMDKENLSGMGKQYGPKEFMGNQELFRKSYGPMEFRGRKHQDVGPDFQSGMNERSFMGMEKSGFGHSKGMFGGGSSEDFSPDY